MQVHSLTCRFSLRVLSLFFITYQSVPSKLLFRVGQLLGIDILLKGSDFSFIIKRP